MISLKQLGWLKKRNPAIAQKIAETLEFHGNHMPAPSMKYAHEPPIRTFSRPPETPYMPPDAFWGAEPVRSTDRAVTRRRLLKILAGAGGAGAAAVAAKRAAKLAQNVHMKPFIRLPKLPTPNI